MILEAIYNGDFYPGEVVVPAHSNMCRPSEPAKI